MTSLHTSRSMTRSNDVRHDVLTAVWLRIQDFWDTELSRICTELSVSKDLVPTSGCRAQRNCVTFKVIALRSYELRITGLLYPQHVETAISRNVGNYFANDKAQYPEDLNFFTFVSGT